MSILCKHELKTAQVKNLDIFFSKYSVSPRNEEHVEEKWQLPCQK
jgi:hypothetical protein